MPTRTTAKLLPPQDWNEFEDLCAALLVEEWRTPYVTRHGRQGQAQQGVDISARPPHLQGGFSGAQCKAMPELTFAEVEAEVRKAKAFAPRLQEFLVMTTAPSDAELQRSVRTLSARRSIPFRVELWAWSDIALRLARHEHLMRQFYGEFIQRTSIREDVLAMVLKAEPGDFEFDGEHEFHNVRDVKLRLVLRAHQDDERASMRMEPDVEPWLKRFPAHALSPNPASKQEVDIVYGSTRIETLTFVWVDGARHLLPMPLTAKDLVVDQLQYQVGRLVQNAAAERDFDHGFSRARFRVEPTTLRSVRGLQELLERQEAQRMQVPREAQEVAAAATSGAPAARATRAPRPRKAVAAKRPAAVKRAGGTPKRAPRKRRRK